MVVGFGFGSRMEKRRVLYERSRMWSKDKTGWEWTKNIIRP